MKKILITFYSWSGNTRRIAELIQKRTDGDVFELKPVQPYTSDYNDVVKQARQEIREGYRPP